MASLHAIILIAALFGPESQNSGTAAKPADLPRLREILYSRQQPLEQSQAALLLIQSDSPDATLIVLEGLRHWDRPDVF